MHLLAFPRRRKILGLHAPDRSSGQMAGYLGVLCNRPVAEFSGPWGSPLIHGPIYRLEIRWGGMRGRDPKLWEFSTWLSGTAGSLAFFEAKPSSRCRRLAVWVVLMLV